MEKLFIQKYDKSSSKGDKSNGLSSKAIFHKFTKLYKLTDYDSNIVNLFID